jgi:hypothetical protein
MSVKTSALIAKIAKILGIRPGWPSTSSEAGPSWRAWRLGSGTRFFGWSARISRQACRKHTENQKKKDKNGEVLHGYKPVCVNEKNRTLCDWPRVKCGECPNRSFAPLDDQAILDHLQGRHTLGVYAMSKDPECIAFVIKTLTLHRLGAPLCPASATS